MYHQEIPDLQADIQTQYKLLNLIGQSEYEIIQENGQRRLTCNELTNNLIERSKGSEVFLGRLPRDCYEDEIVPVLQKVGKLLELRLMLDFSGTNRGFGFALFEDSKTARRACQLLNNSEIRSGHRIGVVKSIDNCRLFFGGVPKDKSKAEFFEELSKMLDGITEIYVYPSSEDRTQNRGFIFVEFRDHRSAAMARRKLIPGRVVLWDHDIAVDWADPEPGDPIDEDVMQTVTALFIRNLPLAMTQQKLKDMIVKATNVPILKIKKLNHFSFVHYENRELAELVMATLIKPGGLAESEEWEIRWAKPIGGVKDIERQRRIAEASCKTIGSKSPESQKSSSHKSRSKGTNKSNNTVENANLPKHDYAQSLQKFVMEKLNCLCHLECIESYEPLGYFCKITIVKDNQIVFQHFGDILPTVQKAINVAARAIYHKLSTSTCVPVSVPAPISIPPPMTNYYYQPAINQCRIPLNPTVYETAIANWQMQGIPLDA
ncbi:probable RNA-binding protein 46 [Leptopilina heterotoma]|uniref:probable RNA-binding protein 46 n=1 Tax=Leptopilina heterotoma TaxID=63436 RepID=UPI001CA8F47E|nr:probable RNA-binding protein 46 [Leptopilina heterotoma]XP_043483069.1 probable RNA-binding protein 46 [Leptopilina heterotoma]